MLPAQCCERSTRPLLLLLLLLPLHGAHWRAVFAAERTKRDVKVWQARSKCRQHDAAKFQTKEAEGTMCSGQSLMSCTWQSPRAQTPSNRLSAFQIRRLLGSALRTRTQPEAHLTTSTTVMTHECRPTCCICTAEDRVEGLYTQYFHLSDHQQLTHHARHAGSTPAQSAGRGAFAMQQTATSTKTNSMCTRTSPSAVLCVC
ncbi:hypothetical protein COO60DRAFT_1520707 [Scenedesmus sp. NREL 46B-D3]|nr:hypothetical protein COO60DRAFT_1520707 [Scenedesmus sp. NREL 46B-D3]